MPYLTNDERIRLGLQHFGSDVPAHEIAAAEQEWRERQMAIGVDPAAPGEDRTASHLLESEPAPVKRRRASSREAK